MRKRIYSAFFQLSIFLSPTFTKQKEMLQEETEADVGASKINRQLSTNDQIPLQMSIQETLMRFRDPESLPSEEGPDSLANYRDERPLTESYLSQTPMVSGLLQCKQDERMHRDTVSGMANPMQQGRNMVFHNSSSRVMGSMSRLDARDVAARESREQKKWDKKVQQQQHIRPFE